MAQNKPEVTQKPKNDPIPDLLKPGDIIFEKYQVLNTLAKGGMDSSIYKGVNITLNPDLSTDAALSTVVIKIVKRLPKMKQHNWIKFCEELVTATRAQHKNLVQTYDVARQYINVNRNNEIIRLDDVAVIVMEYVSGPSLRSLLSNKGYFSVDEAMYYFKKMVLAIRSLHTYSHMIIHRDLKPENILLSEDLRELKIVDFGISSSIIMNGLNNIETITNEKSLFGTVEYMSPDNLEQDVDKNGKPIRKAPTPQLDFHSMGVILFEMLTGEKPFLKDPKEDKVTIKKAKYYDMPVMSGIRYDIPNSVENIVFRCIASKLEDLHFRYKNCDEILQDVETYNSEERRNQPLLKPVGLRVLERNDSFNPHMTKTEEKFFYKRWFFILCTGLIVMMGATVLILSILFFTQ